MKTSRIIAVITLSIITIASFAHINENVDCPQYSDLPFELRFIEPYGMELKLPDQYKGHLPQIDSICITTRIGHRAPEKVFTTFAQWGDTISLDPLLGVMEWAYVCKIWLKGCYLSKTFDFHGWCDEYEGLVISFTRINPPSVILHLEDTITGVVPKIDSMWITSEAFRGFPDALVSGNAQDGDTIDLAPLIGMQDVTYTCWLRIGDCVKRGRFLYYGEEWDYCLEYQDCRLHAEVIENVMEYTLTNMDLYEDFYVDSIWLSTPVERDVILFVSYAQPDEPIDVSMLEEGDYYIRAQIGDCVKGALFYKWGPAVQGVSNIEADTPAATKIIRDGQLFIQRGEKVYTVTGQLTQ